MRKRVLILIALILAFANSGALMIQQSAFAGNNSPKPEKIVICHRTEANDKANNPYNSNSVDLDSTYPNGHDGHDEDIIPPYGDGEYSLGKNWNTAGQAIWNNGCNVTATPSITYTDATCESNTMNYTINKVEGITYYIGSIDKKNEVKSYETVNVESGTKIVIYAKEDKGYVLNTSFTNPWVHTFVLKTKADCTVTPAKVIAVDNASCDNFGGAYFTIPSVEGVEYFIKGTTTPLSAGDHVITSNGKVEIVAKAMDGYAIEKDAATKWKLEFESIPDEDTCGDVEGVTNVTPAAVTFKAPTCSALGSYTIPTTTGVNYLINGKVVAAGFYSGVTGSTTKVTAEPSAENYSIVKGAQTEWSYTFTAPTGCGSVLGETTVKTLPNTSGTGMNPIASIAAFSIAFITLAGAAMKRFYMERL